MLKIDYLDYFEQLLKIIYYFLLFTFYGSFEVNLFTIHIIVIRNGKIVWKKVWYYLSGWTWVPEDTSAQVTSAFIKCKHLICRNISSFSCSDINLFWIDHACYKLCNIWLLLLENNFMNYYYTGALYWREKLILKIDDRW